MLKQMMGKGNGCEMKDEPKTCLDGQILELKNVINKQVAPALIQASISKVNVDNFGLKQSNVSIRPALRKAN